MTCWNKNIFSSEVSDDYFCCTKSAAHIGSRYLFFIAAIKPFNPIKSIRGTKSGHGFD